MSSYRSKGDLTTGPVSRHVLNLTLPMVWGIFVFLSFQLADTYFVSLLGTQELAALSFTFPVTYAVLSLNLGLAIATSSVVARQIGQGKKTRARRMATHALVLAAMAGIGVAVTGLGFLDPMFRAMGAEEGMLVLIKEYMNIWFAGAAFVTLPMVGNAIMRSCGDAVTPALIMTLIAGMNIVLDPLLIFGLWGFPRMELQGAAIATVISYACSVLAMFYVLFCRKKMIARGRRHLRLLGASLKSLLTIAVPAGLANMLQPVLNAVITALLAVYGAEAVAAFGVAGRVEAFFFVPIMALATGMAPVIGQNHGAGLHERVQKTLNTSFVIAVLWSAFVALVLVVFGEKIATLFSQDAHVIRYAVSYFLIVPLTYPIGNLLHGWASAFNAIGQPKRAAIMIFVKMIALGIPAAVIGAHFYGVTGIFCAIATINILTGAGFHFWNKKVWNQTIS